jgi:glyceraldehyde 3-phosphate dehydrogenase
MTKKLFINGAAGRIGVGVTYEVTALKDSNLELVGLNDPAGIDVAVAKYTGRDHVHGVHDWKVEKVDQTHLSINGKVVPFYAALAPSDMHLKELGVEMVLECSGFYGDPKVKDKSVKPTKADNGGRAFLREGIETVIETYPAKTADVSMITGVNTDLYEKAMAAVSNASCTTKALSMPLKALLDSGVEIYALSMDTTHAATGKDLAKLFALLDNADNGKPITRAQLEDILEMKTHSTGAAKATGLVIPSLAGKMAGMSYRVPTLDGSFANLYFVAASTEELTAERVNAIIKEASTKPEYNGRLGVFEGEDAATKDIVGRRENGVFVPSKTNVIPLPFGPEGKKAYLVTVISGYDNELGSAVDPVLLANYIAAHS